MMFDKFVAWLERLAIDLHGRGFSSGSIAGVISLLYLGAFGVAGIGVGAVFLVLISFADGVLIIPALIIIPFVLFWLRMKRAIEKDMSNYD